MEEKKIKKNGLQLIGTDSSELCNIKGGVSLRGLKEFLRACIEVIEALIDLLPPFTNGFKDGWNRSKK